MKQIILITFSIIVLISCSQTTETGEQKSENNTEFVSFETTLDIANATKEGIYVDEYVVHIDYDKANELNGKKVIISGDVSIVKGLDNTEKEYDKSGNEIFSQGRSSDTKHIVNPTIKIIEE